jgi:small conductance mechanosensitive channel
MEFIKNWFSVSGYKPALIVGLSILAYIFLRIAGRRIVKALAKVKIIKSDRTANENELRIKTLSKVIINTGGIVIFIIAVLTLLQNFGINIAPILAGAGVAGIAIGFGAQSLIKDILNGFFILLEGQFVEGDFVKIKDKVGVVEDFNLRRTILRDFKGDIHVIPNSQITISTNLTYGWARVLIDVMVPYEESMKAVLSLLRKIGEEFSKDEKFKGDILKPVEILGIEEFTDLGIVIKISVKTVPAKQWDVRRELLKRIKLAFDKEGIEISHRRVAVKK